MTTLITGATGFVGGWIARLLAKEGMPLRALVRPGRQLPFPAGPSVETVEGDLLDLPSLRRAMQGVRQVYHAAGFISFRRRDAVLVRQINDEGAVNLFKAAMEAGVERVVYTASIFALGCAKDAEHPAREDHFFNAPDLLDIPYLRAKYDAELAAQEATKRGLPLIRLYPGLCLGPGDVRLSSSAAIAEWLRGRLPAIITGGGICLMDVRDAAAAHIAAMRQGEVGRRYLAHGHNVTLTGLFRQLERLTGRPAPRLQLPLWAGLPLAWLAEQINYSPALDSAQARLMACYWWYDSTLAQRELGITFRPLDETLMDTVNWLTAASRGEAYDG
jgi:dihydroflavonol-4-reductase